MNNGLTLYKVTISVIDDDTNDTVKMQMDVLAASDSKKKMKKLVKKLIQSQDKFQYGYHHLRIKKIKKKKNQELYPAVLSTTVVW
jgi:hypothetical protein